MSANQPADEQTTTGEQAGAAVDEAFIRRALEDADLNALRIALYQVTCDESLLAMKLRRTPAYGGTSTLTEVDADDHPALKAKALAFLQAKPVGFQEVTPDDDALRRMFEAFRNEKLTEKDWRYRRDLAAFDEHPRLARWSGGKPQVPDGYRVAIIGAGFDGISMGVQLEKVGIPYTIYERRPELGGTWSRNVYPDVRVDTTNFMYQFTFEKNYPWKEYFARAPEVRAYLEHVADKYGLKQHMQFNADVRRAVFDEESGTWTLTICSGGSGPGGGTEQLVTVNAVVSASGLFANPKHFDVPGAEYFRGQLIHTAECTGQEDLDGKDVAIIGNGSTGVQMMSAVAKRARSVGVFQRTPQWIAPRERYGEHLKPETRWLLDTMPYYWNWYIYSIGTMRLGMQRTQEFDPAWQAAGGQVSKANDELRATLTNYIKSKVGSRPDLVEKLTPQHAPMARRMIVDNNWYATLLQDHVELVTDKIEQLTPDGILTADGQERHYDIIFTATGFDVEKYLWPTEFRGLGGYGIEEHWTDPAGDGPRAYLSLTVPGFPNLFIMYGPNSQNRAGSLIVWMEIWSRYIAQALIATIEGGHRYVTVKPAVFEDYNRRHDAAMRELIWYDKASMGRNYYVNHFGRQQVNVAWRLEDQYESLERFNLDDYTFG
ncbi:MAG: flavin-containing monooxygenase [Trebonia sp.]